MSWLRALANEKRKIKDEKIKKMSENNSQDISFNHENRGFKYIFYSFSYFYDLFFNLHIMIKSFSQEKTLINRRNLNFKSIKDSKLDLDKKIYFFLKKLWFYFKFF